MIFNYDFVVISSMSGIGFRSFEAETMDKMISKLEEMRKAGEIHSTNHAVLMTGYKQPKSGLPKKQEVYKLLFIDERWMMPLQMPSKTRTRSLCR